MAKSIINLVVLISGSGTNLQSIIDSISMGKLDANICAVISDRHDAYGLQRAIDTKIETIILCPSNFKNNQQYDDALADTIADCQPDLIVLAGFMRILSYRFVNRFEGKIFNIHPSLLPKFKGLNTHQRALDDSVEKHGATVHFVTADLDDGPVVIQAEVDVLPDDTAEILQQRVLQQEHLIYPKAIQWFAEGMISMTNPCPCDT